MLGNKTDNRPEDNKVLPVSSSVKWVGVLDFDIVTFDVVMTTEYGTTYNSYFIDAEKKAVIETTKEKFWDVYLAKLQQVCNPEEIDYIILNHTEPDHSGNVGPLLKIAPNAKIVGSGQAIRYMKDLLGYDFPNIVVKDGDKLSLGNRELTFISAPNLHWPDSMYTWLEEEKVLFTCDSFGAHFCDERMYDNEVGNYDDAFKYYFDVILKPYSKFMLKAIDKIRHLDIAAICTGHGPLLTHDLKRYVDLSEQYAREAMQYPLQKHVFIPYVSAYQKTGQIAEAIGDGVRSVMPDAQVDVQDIETTPLGELDEKIARSQAIVVGCPTINQNILLQVYKLFALINPIRDKGKIGGAFGSYGWSGEAANLIYANLKNLKLNMTEDSLFVKFTPHKHQLEQAREYGRKIGAQVLLKQTEGEDQE
jgi:NADH oxidase (H2O-forming)